jgi:hypothetical protein
VNAWLEVLWEKPADRPIEVIRGTLLAGSEKGTIGIQSRVEAQAAFGERSPGVECIALQMIGWIVENTAEENNGYVAFTVQ